MRKVTGTVVAVVMALALASSAQAGGGTGAYEWKISFSSTNPDSQVSAPLGGLGQLYLWYMGCNTDPSGAGMSAAEMDVVFTSWTPLGFTVQNGYLNAGGTTSLLLAVGSCPTGPVVAGSWFVNGPSGKVRLAPAVSTGEATTVDCNTTVPGLYLWPGQVRFVGAGTTDAGALQDWGKGCTLDPVEPTTWGSVKALYR